MLNTVVGIDLVEVKRFRDFNFGSKLAINIFTIEELEECKKKSSPGESLAGRFAAKEAVKKTLDENIKLNRIEIIHELSGKPVVNFLDPALKKKYISKISISHTNDLAQAICFTIVK